MFYLSLSIIFVNVGLVVKDLETDLSDGLKLIALLEILQQKRIRKITKPINHHQYLENVQFALESIENDGIKLVNIGQYFRSK